MAYVYYGRRLDKKGDALMDKLRTDDKRPEVGARALMTKVRFARLHMRKADAAIYLEQIMQEYPGSQEARQADKIRKRMLKSVLDEIDADL